MRIRMPAKEGASLWSVDVQTQPALFASCSVLAINADIPIEIRAASPWNRGCLIIYFIPSPTNKHYHYRGRMLPAASAVFSFRIPTLLHVHMYYILIEQWRASGTKPRTGWVLGRCSDLVIFMCVCVKFRTTSHPQLPPPAWQWYDVMTFFLLLLLLTFGYTDGHHLLLLLPRLLFPSNRTRTTYQMRPMFRT